MTDRLDAAKSLNDLRRAGVPDRFMQRLVRAVDQFDRATAHLATLPRWKVFILANGSSTSVIVSASTADRAKRDAIALGYNVTGLVVAIK